jgi:RNA polymerase sporulation-specific sigma factor
MSDEKLAELEMTLQKYKPLVISRARAHFMPGGDMQDLVQEGMIGLYKAVLAYDSEKGAFAAFAELCITRQLATAVKAATRRKHALLTGAGELEDISHDASNPEAMFISREAAANIDDFIQERLTGLEQAVLRSHMAGLSHATIADKLGITKKSADNALQRIRRKIRGHVEG